MYTPTKTELAQIKIGQKMMKEAQRKLRIKQQLAALPRETRRVNVYEFGKYKTCFYMKSLVYPE